VLKRIVAYDYSPNILTLFQRVLSREGFEVFLSASPMTCWEVEEFQPDLIILGYVVGYLDNELDILRQLRQNPSTASIPVIICTTGARHLQGREEIITDDWLAVVSKPFEIGQLLSAVDTLLKRQQTHSNPKHGLTAESAVSGLVPV